MPIGTGVAILGSSLLGMGASALGARGANRAAEDNAAVAQGNIEAANQAIYQSLDPAHAARGRGAGIIGEGYQGAADQYGEGLSPYASQAPGMYDYLMQNRNIAAPSQWQAISGSPNEVMSNFYASPDYRFRKQEGLDAVQNSAAAGGAGLFSGNTLRGITDYASNLAAGEFGDYINRQMGIGGLEYGRDVDNYGRSAGLTDTAMTAEDMARNVNYGTGRDITNAYAGVEGARAQDLLGAGRGYAGNLVGNAQIQAQTPYVSPYGGVNNAAQGGIQNYMWAQNAGLTGQQPQYDFQGRPISNKPQPYGPQVGWAPPPKLYGGLPGGGIG